MLNLDLIYNYLAQGRWFRLVSKDGNISIGKQIFSVGRKRAHQHIELTFHGSERRFHCFDQAGQLIKVIPAWKITKEVLMGDLAKVLSLPFFQLALPFDANARRVVRFFEIIPGMT